MKMLSWLGQGFTGIKVKLLNNTRFGCLFSNIFSYCSTALEIMKKVWLSTWILQLEKLI